METKLQVRISLPATSKRETCVRYYNQWVSLLGTLLCVVVMFLMDHITALITFICIICLYICVSVRKPDANWGSSTQAQAFVTALKASQNLSR